MANNSLNARVIHIHDIESNWKRAYSFIPRMAEIVVYDPDDTHPYPRFKIGNGISYVNDLPFAVEAMLQDFFQYNNEVMYNDAGSITEYTDI